MQEKLSSVLKHPTFEELFFILSQGREKRYKEYGKEFDFARFMDHRTDCFYTHVVEDDALNPKKRPILLCDYSCSFLLEDSRILKGLLEMGFSVSILLAGNKLQEISTADLKDKLRLKTWLSQCQFFRKQTSSSQQENQLWLALKAAGQQDMERWNILDNYAWQRLNHALILDAADSLTTFEYSFSPAKKTPYQELFNIEPQLNETSLRRMLEYIPVEFVSVLDLGKTVPSSYIAHFSRLKSLKFDGAHTELQMLIQNKQIARLYIYQALLSKLPQHLPDNLWSLKVFLDKDALPRLPATMHELDLYKIKPTFRWPASWPPKLKQMWLEFTYPITAIPALPAGLTDLELGFSGDLPPLTGLPAVKKLGLRAEKHFPESFKTKDFPNLVDIYLHHNVCLPEDQASKEAPKNLPLELPEKLRHLHFMNCCIFDTAGMSRLIKKYPNVHFSSNPHDEESPQLIDATPPKPRRIPLSSFFDHDGGLPPPSPDIDYSQKPRPSSQPPTKIPKFATTNSFDLVHGGMPSMTPSYLDDMKAEDPAVAALRASYSPDDYSLPSLPGATPPGSGKDVKERKKADPPSTNTWHAARGGPSSEPLFANYTIFNILHLGKKRVDDSASLLVPLDRELYRETVCDQLSLGKDSLGTDILISKSSEANFIPVTFLKKSTTADELPITNVVVKAEEFSEADLLQFPSGHHFVELFFNSKTPSNALIPLPGLKASDQIVCLHSTPCIPVELLYDQQNHQYVLFRPMDSMTDDWPLVVQYVFTTANQNIIRRPPTPALTAELHHLFATVFSAPPSPDSHPEFQTLHQEIQRLYTQKGKIESAQIEQFAQTQLVEFFKSYTPTTAQKNFLDFLYQKQGSCEIRSILAMWICRSLGLPARVISNSSNSFLELYINDSYTIINLNGAYQVATPAAKNPFTVTSTQHLWKSHFSAASKKDREQKAIEPAENILKKLAQPTKILLSIENIHRGRNIYPALQKVISGKQIIYLETAEQLESQWRSCRVSPSGEPEKMPGRLRNCLELAGDVWLIINWGGFTPAQIASYMSINDKERILKGIGVPDHVHVINLLPESMKDVVGPRFLSRVPELVWPPQTAWPADIPFDLSLSASSQTASSRHHESADLVEIDLYNGEVFDWQKVLQGHFSLSKGGFRYNKGKLQLALEQPAQGLKLFDPPQGDRAFQLFMLDLRCQRRFIANGVELILPEDFQILLSSSPTKKLLPAPQSSDKDPIPFGQPETKNQPSKRKRDVASDEVPALGPSSKKGKRQSSSDAMTDINPGRVERYINRSNFQSLFNDIIIRDGGQEEIHDWLLQESTGTHKTIVLTEPLLPGQQRYLQEKLPYTSVTVDVCDLSNERLARKEIAAGISWKQEAEHSRASCLIESTDPWFVAQQLTHTIADALLVPIHARTESNELLESPKPDFKLNKIDIQIKTVAQALRAGQTVVLYGNELSKELYQALEPLFDHPPKLKVFAAAEPQPVRGRLLIAVSRLGFTPRLAQWKGRHLALPTQLWQDYHQQIIKDYPLRQYPHYPKLLEKIAIFYQLADQIKHGQTGTPALPRLSYARLRYMLQALANPMPGNSNLFKAFFPHDYDHNSEAYAYLIVIMKLALMPVISSPDKPDSKDDIPGGRWDKFDNYPKDSQYFWRRLNCLNASALQQLFEQQDGGPLPHLDQAGAAIPDAYLNNFRRHSIQKQVDPQAKVKDRLDRFLERQSMVTLIGEPGTGKTYIAEQYANALGRKKYWGEADIGRWLSDAGKIKEKILIIDEANMSASGYWDFLMPLLNSKTPKIFWQGKFYQLSRKHKVIFTGNPAGAATYSATRVYQGVLQDTPQIYVKAWTRETLKQRVLLPRLLALSAAKPLDFKASPPSSAIKSSVLSADSSTEIVEGLLTATQLTNHLLDHPTAGSEALPSLMAKLHKAPVVSEELTVRDLQQLLCRMSHCSNDSTWQQAAFEACLIEWSRRFPNRKSQRVFQQQIAQLFQQKKSEITELPAMKAYQGILKDIGQKYHLCREQEAWLLTICQDMDLAKDARFYSSAHKTSGVKRGVLLEGGSGLGKTTMLVELAKAMKLRGLTPDQLEKLLEGLGKDAALDLNDCYLQFTPSADAGYDEDLLLKAFHSGCKVVLDEFNLAPTLENLLNQLLTGKAPGGQPAKHAGFYVLASQNSTVHAGSKASSPALKNRLHLLYTDLFKEDLAEAAERAIATVISDVGTQKKLAQEIMAGFAEAQAAYPLAVNTRNFFEGLSQIISELKETMQPRASSAPAPQKAPSGFATVFAGTGRHTGTSAISEDFDIADMLDFSMFA